MKIYFDENMPFATEFFTELSYFNDGIIGKQGELVPFSGRTLTAEQVADADVLLVRSITQVNEQLLHLNDKISFVGSATIGTGSSHDCLHLHIYFSINIKKIRIGIFANFFFETYIFNLFLRWSLLLNCTNLKNDQT